MILFLHKVKKLSFAILFPEGPQPLVNNVYQFDRPLFLWDPLLLHLCQYLVYLFVAHVSPYERVLAQGLLHFYPLHGLLLVHVLGAGLPVSPACVQSIRNELALRGQAVATSAKCPISFQPRLCFPPISQPL